MRPITRTTICALAAAALAAPAFAAADYYLRLDDVKGGAAAKASGGTQFAIESWSWGATNAAKFGAISGAHRDDGVTAPAEKRQHGWMPSNRPLDRGSVRVKVKFPWLDCRVGAAFPDAVLQNSAGRYELKDVQVTGCAAGAGQPADSITLNYTKVRVRGWDPATK